MQDTARSTSAAAHIFRESPFSDLAGYARWMAHLDPETGKPFAELVPSDIAAHDDFHATPGPVEMFSHICTANPDAVTSAPVLPTRHNHRRAKGRQRQNPFRPEKRR
jgi:hypothetical protein